MTFQKLEEFASRNRVNRAYHAQVHANKTFALRMVRTTPREGVSTPRDPAYVSESLE